MFSVPQLVGRPNQSATSTKMVSINVKQPQPLLEDESLMPEYRLFLSVCNYFTMINLPEKIVFGVFWRKRCSSCKHCADATENVWVPMSFVHQLLDDLFDQLLCVHTTM